MTDAEFFRLSTYIYEKYGIKLPLSKKTMLDGRLQKRLKQYNFTSYTEYSNYVFSAEGLKTELPHMIDEVTTNKTEFFRESHHFDFLTSTILPQFYNNQPVNKTFHAWSAGCSTGEEPYTLAMVLNEYKEINSNFNYEILGTDLSVKALDAAIMAVYSEEKVQPVTLTLKKKYFLRSKEAKSKTVRIIPELRAKVVFQKLNFIDGDMGSLPIFNTIFCRNVLIYFDKPTQEKVIKKLCSKLKEGGYLFLGHSESITNMILPLIQIYPTIFRKT